MGQYAGLDISLNAVSIRAHLLACRQIAKVRRDSENQLCALLRTADQRADRIGGRHAAPSPGVLIRSSG